MKRRNLSKITALFLALSLCISLTGTALATSFQDVPEASAYSAALTELADKGLVKGTGKATFQPERATTLAELVTFLGRIAGVTADQTALPEGAVKDGWSNGYLAWAISHGLTDGKIGQYSALTATQVDAVLASYCAMLKIDTVKLDTTSAQVKRGELVTTLAALTEADFTHLTAVNYTTVTEVEDWGPAITKVVLDLGVALDKASVNKESFTAASVRTVPGMDFATMTPTPPAAQTAARTVTAAYLSDAKGVAANSGNYVTVEMAIGPDKTEGSPFNYDFVSGKNSYIEINHVVTMAAGASVTAKTGKAITMEPTTAGGNKGTATLLADDFDTKGTYTNDNNGNPISLTYASWTPNKDAAKGSTPLIIWLHGAGEGGTNPYISIVGNKVVNLVTKDVQQYFGKTGAQVLAPQSPTVWMDYDGTGTYNTSVEDSMGKSYYTETLMGLIKDYVAKHPELDTSRIYLGGCSNGGYMTVNMAATYPGYFAAAYPVCEAFDAKWLTEETLANLATIPMWLTAAETDSIVPICEGKLDMSTFTFTMTLDKDGKPIPVDNFSNALYSRLEKLGAKNLHYSKFPNVEDTSGKYFMADGVTPYEYSGHFSWVQALNNECVEKIDGKDVTLFQWLSQQKLAK